MFPRLWLRTNRQVCVRKVSGESVLHCRWGSGCSDDVVGCLLLSVELRSEMYIANAHRP
jgi:hypothetical protein